MSHKLPQPLCIEMQLRGGTYQQQCFGRAVIIRRVSVNNRGPEWFCLQFGRGESALRSFQGGRVPSYRGGGGRVGRSNVLRWNAPHSQVGTGPTWSDQATCAVGSGEERPEPLSHALECHSVRHGTAQWHASGPCGALPTLCPPPPATCTVSCLLQGRRRSGGVAPTASVPRQQQSGSAEPLGVDPPPPRAPPSGRRETSTRYRGNTTR